MKKLLNQKVIAFSITSIIFTLYIIPYLVLKQGTFINAWDNLDSYLPWYKVLSEYGWWQPLNFTIPNFLDGMPRNCFHSEFIFQVAIFNFLSPFKAYVVIDLISRFTAFIGMYLLLKDHFLKENPDEFILCGSAIAFAFIPNLMTMAFLTVMGVPLLLWAFLNIRAKNHKAYNWIILALMPCCVNFELITPFFLTCICILWIYDFIKNKKPDFVMLGAIILYSIISLITIYRFAYLMLFQDFSSHRLEWNVYTQHGVCNYLYEAIIGGLKVYITSNGNGWDYTNTKLLVMPICIIATIISVLTHYNRKIIATIWTTMIFIAIWFGIITFYPPALDLQNRYATLRQFQVTRFYFLIPTLWYINFALSLDVIKQRVKYIGKYLILVIVISQVIITYNSPYFYLKDNYNYLTKTVDSQHCYSFRDYFAEGQYKEIKDFIGRPQNTYKVALAEVQFGTASYNGFYVMNDYFNIYPLEYKHKFEKIVAPAMEEDLELKNMIKNWGHKQWIPADENKFNTKVLKTLGCEYIFSGKKIVQKKSSKLIFLKKFEGGKLGTPLYVYRLK